jgi:hypothetical protein
MMDAVGFEYEKILAENALLRDQRDQLWKLLDEIDTLDDSCRSDDGSFRYMTRRAQKRRFDIYDPDKRTP